MPSLDLFPEEDQSGIVFCDVIMLALCGFVAIVLLLLHLNPPATAATESITPPANVIIEARWPDEMDTDVDLWVGVPGDSPVGYSNKGGAYFNFLRDNLGYLSDAAEINYEVSYSRGIPSGEYTVNFHLSTAIFPAPTRSPRRSSPASRNQPAKRPRKLLPPRSS